MSRAARNSTCCGHPAADHDLFGCGVNLSSEPRTYTRCHGYVEADHDGTTYDVGGIPAPVLTTAVNNSGAAERVIVP